MPYQEHREMTPVENERYQAMLKHLPPITHSRELHGNWIDFNASDRGMSLSEWQDWIVDLIIKKHDEGCSDNQVRMIFAVEFDKRYGKSEVAK